MKIKDFFTEQFFADYEFNVEYQICNSDCEPLTVGELFKLAGRDISEFESRRLGYTEATGSLQIRQAISDLYPTVSPQSIVMLGSPVEGIFLVANALLNKGEEVIVLNPAYDALRNTFEFVVGRDCVKTWSYVPRGNGWHLDLSELEKLISSQTKMLVVNFPHNPTGFVPSPQFQQELGEIAAKNGITVFCDEIYFGLVHDARDEIPSMVEVDCNTIVLSGLSKTYGLPGLRAGWLIISDDSKQKDIVNWKHYTSLCPAAPTEYLASVAISVLPELRHRSLSIVRENLRVAAEFFNRWDNVFTWYPPAGGTTALVHCRIQPVSELAIRLANEANVLILPAIGLGMNDDHFRLGLGRSNFSSAMRHFERWLLNERLATDEN